MALPLARAARALADNFRQQASQIQTLIDSNGFITALGFVDRTNFHMAFPRTLIPQHEDAMDAMWKAKSALNASADVMDLRATDMERIVLEAVAATARESRNSRRAYPY